MSSPHTRWRILLSLFGAVVFACLPGYGQTDASPASFSQAQYFLEHHGYPATEYELLLTWNETTPADQGGYVRGYRVRRIAEGATFELYSREGMLLEDTEWKALGVVEKPWDGAAEMPLTPLASVKARARVAAAIGPEHGIAPSAEVVLPPVDLAKLAREDGARPAKALPRIGVYRPLPAPVDVFGGWAGKGYWSVLADGSTFWSMRITATGALGMRVSVPVLELPEGAGLRVYSEAQPERAYGPYRSVPPGEPALWTPACFGETLVIECHVPADALLEHVAIQVNRISHFYKSPAALLRWPAGACNNDVACFGGWAEAALAVGGLGVQGPDGTLFCTCALIAADPCAGAAYVLTANHCVDGQNKAYGAEQLDFFWRYQTDVCDGAPPALNTVPMTGGGADYVAGMRGDGYDGGGNDFTLLRPRNSLPAGLYQLGWTTAVPQLGTEVVCIHHPRGDFKRISFGNLTDIKNQQPALYHESLWYDGTTEPGSSGSPLVLASTGQLIGQLWGGRASCSLPDEPDFYGRFDRTWPLVARHLNPAPVAALAEAEVTGTEGAGPIAVTVVLSQPAPPAGGEVAYSVSGGTAVPGEDFEAAAGTLAFPAGALEATLAVALIDDTHYEPGETVLVELAGTGCVRVTEGGAGVVTILDDDIDTDGDGLSDYDEENGVFGPASDPAQADTDHDGRTDYEEVTGAGGFLSDPTRYDTDGDGVNDFYETLTGFDPADPSEAPALSSLAVPWFRRR